ncbi:hypothetical protein Egran_00645 [Elaphomyces granulatus]|uniref:Amine oxidase domain-containing protein n=1 Tax=Elaphomyces granulatus TaxID=519963 RepID=A0A232M5N6_9EURO|nr:hypothetical protein Egran_00645 [Elaphomyces granulatus]
MKLLAVFLLYASIREAIAVTTNREQRRDTAAFDPSRYDSSDIIYRDVAVIGGGSTGTYGAIKLRDMGKSVVLVEKEQVLGGHENTYIDPTTGTPIDFGVQAYWNIPVVTDFFARFNISIGPYGFSGYSTTFADFTTGQTIPNFTLNYNLLTAYNDQLNKYPDLSWSWNLPSPIPDDLLMPFGQFIEKYSLQDSAYALWTITGGVTNPFLLDQVTVNVMKWLDHAYMDETINGNAVTTTKHDNGELYVKALAELGSDALLSSTVTAAQRPEEGGVSLVVSTPKGDKLIVASKLLITIPLLVGNMKPFDVDDTEENLFKKFHYSCYYVGLVNNTGFPGGYRYLNAAANDTYNIPHFPGLYFINPTIEKGIYLYWYGSLTDLTQEEIESDVATVIHRLSNSTQEPNFLAFASHTPFKLEVTADDITNGFYDQLYALQGHRDTWYTGAAMISHNAGVLWNFTQALLPRIVA